MKQDNTQEQLKDLLVGAKKYYVLQKEYLKLTMTEQLTHLMAKIIIILVSVISSFLIVMFLGLALVHWVGEAIGNIGLCYAIFALFMAVLFIVFYSCRRNLVMLPMARMMTQIFLKETDEETEMEEINDEREE